MNKSSHILMGRFLYQYAERHYKIRLEPRSYILGNILPDYSPSFLIRPHFLKNNAAHVQNIIRLLLSRHPSAYNDKKYSRLLGVLCHFYADFFCHVHREDFTGSLSEHFAYEKKLNRYFMENLNRFGSLHFITQPVPVTRAEDIYRRFETLHSGYLLSHSSFGNDLMYAMIACIDLIVMITGYTAESGLAGDRRFKDLEAV